MFSRDVSHRLIWLYVRNEQAEKTEDWRLVCYAIRFGDSYSRYSCVSVWRCMSQTSQLCTQSLLGKARSNRSCCQATGCGESRKAAASISFIKTSFSHPFSLYTGKLLRGRCPQVPGTVPPSSAGLFRHVEAKGKAMFLAAGLDTTFLVHSG